MSVDDSFVMEIPFFPLFGDEKKGLKAFRRDGDSISRYLSEPFLSVPFKYSEFKALILLPSLMG